MQGEIHFGIPKSGTFSDGTFGSGAGASATGTSTGYEYHPVFISSPRGLAHDNTSYDSIFNGAFIGGSDHTTYTGATDFAFVGGTGNTISTNVERSVVIGGSDITASTNDMVYVPDLVIDGLTSVTDLQTDANGQIIDGASDITLKDNVETLENPLEKVLALNPVSFEWKPEMNLREGKVFGLIAQEVKEVIPEIVRERAKGNGTLTLEYKEIIPWLVGAVQQLASGYETTGLKDNDSELKTDKYGRWIASPALSSKHLILPEFTPTSTNDERGTTGDSVWDDDYIYIKTNGGWKRSSLENF
jgi:hypothetical protein